MYVGYRSYHIGYLKYEDGDGGESVDYFWVIMISLTALFVTVICVWIVCAITCRRKAKDREEKRRQALLAKTFSGDSGGSSILQADDWMFPNTYRSGQYITCIM